MIKKIWRIPLNRFSLVIFTKIFKLKNMKKITFILSLFLGAAVFAQNPFEADMIFETSTTFCAGDGNGNCDPENSDLEIDSFASITTSEATSFDLDDVSGGVYLNIYNSSNQPATVNVNTADQTLSIDEFEDIFGDLFSAEGTYVLDDDDNLVSFELDWENSWGDDGVTTYTLTSLTEVPDAAINPDPADGETVFLSEGTNQAGDPVLQYLFNWELPEDSEIATGYTFELGIAPGDYVFETSTGGPSLLLSGLQLDATYYWRVTPTNPVGGATGAVEWTFTTEPTMTSEEFIEENAFVHYVNRGQLFMQANTTIDNAQIFNMAGKQVVSKKFNNSDVNVNLTNLANGIYIVKVETENGSHSFKIVK